ncbi:hypothetical protein GGI25_001656 [Coemansia spiralis]|uniref:PITH domain-containing protein n=2 Tax=Coemansia TaxID=4863 RepID=A0A9W8GBU5_9FUNG|nr:hypothetical protein EDC05_005496 [Coemansia umbellata]KAJ2623912.1 hypothetical protein GGI26_001927 [Coemansia sp. RSA 1358]KAJ2679300.1 hypothetical protein GGI25_001656 [Coemansia spiralis]
MSHCHGEANDHDHDHDHDHSHGHSHDADADTGIADSLFGKVNTDETWCLNESVPEAIKTVFKPWHQRLDTTRYVESDADAELLVFVPFTGMVKLKSIFVWGRGESAPSEVRVFANRDDLDFDSVGDARPTQEWALVDQAREPVEYPVRAAKFGAVRSLLLHFPASFGADQTAVYFLAFRGEWTELVDAPVVSVYEAKPNVADHKAPAGENFAHHSIS